MKEQLIELLNKTTQLFSGLTLGHRRSSQVATHTGSSPVSSHTNTQSQPAASRKTTIEPSEERVPRIPAPPPPPSPASQTRLVFRRSAHIVRAASVTPATTPAAATTITTTTTTITTTSPPVGVVPSLQSALGRVNSAITTSNNNSSSSSSSNHSSGCSANALRGSDARPLHRRSVSQGMQGGMVVPLGEPGSVYGPSLPSPPLAAVGQARWHVQPCGCGAREWIEHVFSPALVGREAGALPWSPNTTSPRSADLDPDVHNRGIPFVQPSEPVDAVTGRRAVYFGRCLPPVTINGEKRERFIGVVMRASPSPPPSPPFAGAALAVTPPPPPPFAPAAANLHAAPEDMDSASTCVGRDANGGARGGVEGRPILFGTVLGYSEDNRAIVWQCRTQRYATRLFVEDVAHIYRAVVARCVHCAQVILRTELMAHVQTHLRGEGARYGILMDDPTLGTACGDTGLLRRLRFLRRLGEGAQGVVDLYALTSHGAPGTTTTTTAMKTEHDDSDEEERESSSSSSQRRTTGDQSTDEATASAAPHKEGDRQRVVVKTMTYESGARAWESYHRAVRLLTSITHPHLVHYLAVQLLPEARTVRLVMPFYREGDLLSAIRGFRGSHFDEEYIRSVALQLTDALVFLHDTTKPPVVHGDVKVENVMLYNQGRQVVLMDFDASGELRGHHCAVHTSLGTTAYMAPEVVRDGVMMPASDMWSLGVLLYVFTVLPDFPMILHPHTMEPTLLNAEIWRTATASAPGSLVQTASAIMFEPHRAVREDRAASLAACLTIAIQRKGFSPELTRLIVELLNFDPVARPNALQVKTRLTDMMVDTICCAP